MDEFSPEQVEEVYRVFDPEGEGIRVKDIGTVIRATGLNPPASFISEVQADAREQSNHDDTCSFDTFLGYIHKARSLASGGGDADSAKADAVRDGIAHYYEKVFPVARKLQTVDSVSLKHLAHVLTRMGDKMTEEEVDDLMREVRKSCAVENSRANWAELKKVVM